MSTCGACFGTALVLNDEEFTRFVNSYAEIHPDSRLESAFNGEGDDLIEECPLYGGGDKEFYVEPARVENCSGMQLIPFLQRDGKWNVTIYDKEKIQPGQRSRNILGMRTVMPFIRRKI